MSLLVSRLTHQSEGKDVRRAQKPLYDDHNVRQIQAEKSPWAVARYFLVLELRALCMEVMLSE